MVSHHPTKLGGHGDCGSKDITVLVCHMILHNIIYNGTYNGI